MVLDGGTGNVGVGVVPIYIFHVVSAISDRMRLELANGQIDIVTYGAGGADYNDTGGIYNEDQSTLVMTGLIDTGDIRFITRTTADGYTERMRIASGGNVGIGTVGPLALFEVNGGAVNDPLTILDALSDDDSAFINFKGVSEVGNTKSITTGAIGLFRMGVRIQINGVDHWLAAYN